MIVSIVTASSDTYFDGAESPFCQSAGYCGGGTFSPNASSTYSVLQKDGFNITYLDGDSAAGDYGTDVIQIGDVSFSGLQFGVATSLKSDTGPATNILGLGYSYNEVAGTLYPNILDVLVDAGVIQTRLFSLFLGADGM